VLDGAEEAGAQVDLVHLPDHVSGMLRDCRECRGDDGQCTIDDGYETIFIEKFLPADAVVYATPLWWYGVSGHLKTFIDRIFCYISTGYPEADKVNAALPGKRAALVLSAEESYFGSRLGVIQQMQECCRYLHHPFVGMITGVANTRGEVAQDPTNPLHAARDLGRHLFNIRATDYRLDTERPGRVWGGEEQFFPAHWR
jgi:putative NADPH-quinone reductase